MAEDGILSFKFRDSDDSARDTAVLEVSKLLFSEVPLARADESLAEAKSEPLHDDGAVHVDSFDFAEGFDFML